MPVKQIHCINRLLAIFPKLGDHSTHPLRKANYQWLRRMLLKERVVGLPDSQDLLGVQERSAGAFPPSCAFQFTFLFQDFSFKRTYSLLFYLFLLLFLLPFSSQTEVDMK